MAAAAGPGEETAGAISGPFTLAWCNCVGEVAQFLGQVEMASKSGVPHIPRSALRISAQGYGHPVPFP